MESDPTSEAAASDSSFADHAVPGHSVDVLRAQGKAAEARAEFERLIQEGAESGIDPRLPAAIFDAVRAQIAGGKGAGATP